MAKKKKSSVPASPPPASTILAIKRPDSANTENVVTNDAPSPPPLPLKPSIEVSEHTPEFQSKEQKPKIPPLVTLPSTTNAAGEVFRVGDQIMVSAPWGERESAEIVMIYEGSECTWVEYNPVEPVKEGWQWERGIVTAVRLVKCLRSNY